VWLWGENLELTALQFQNRSSCDSKSFLRTPKLSSRFASTNGLVSVSWDEVQSASQRPGSNWENHKVNSLVSKRWRIPGVCVALIVGAVVSFLHLHSHVWGLPYKDSFARGKADEWHP